MRLCGRKEFQQVKGIVLVIVMDVGEEVVLPLAHIDLCQGQYIVF